MRDLLCGLFLVAVMEAIAREAIDPDGLMGLLVEHDWSSLGPQWSMVQRDLLDLLVP